MGRGAVSEHTFTPRMAHGGGSGRHFNELDWSDPENLVWMKTIAKRQMTKCCGS